MANEISTATGDFVAAEEAARELVASLGRLNEASESYSEAGKTLGVVGSQIVELAERTAEVGTRTAEAVDALRSVGSAQILEQVSVLSSAFEAQQEQLMAVTTSLSEFQSEQTAIRSSLDSLGAQHSTATESVRAELAGVKTMLSGMTERIQALEKMSRNAFLAALAATLLAALAAVLTRV